MLSSPLHSVDDIMHTYSLRRPITKIKQYTKQERIRTEFKKTLLDEVFWQSILKVCLVYSMMRYNVCKDILYYKEALH